MKKQKYYIHAGATNMNHHDILYMMKEILLKKLRQDFPQLVEQSTDMDILYGRHSYVCDLATPQGNYIFKFPINVPYYNIRREADILNYLDGKLSVSHPVIEFIGESVPCIGYQKIEKQQLTYDVVAKLSKKEQEGLFEKLAQFLYEMHGCTEDIKRSIEIPKDRSQKYPENIVRYAQKDKTESDLRDYALKIAEDYNKWWAEREVQPTFIYNDLHFGNVLMDDDGEVAIIDFGFCGIGNIHREFHQMHKCNDVMLDMLIDKYQTVSGQSLDKEGVILISKIDQLNYYFSLLYAQKGISTENDKYVDNVKKIILQWMAE